MTPYAVELIEDRDRFRSLLTEWLQLIKVEQARPNSILAGLRIALDEGTIHSPRFVRKAGMKFKADDAVHMPNSVHHEGCAQDFVIWQSDDMGGYDYIENGDHPAYRLCGRLWTRLDPRCFWGESINDSNHISLRRGARA